MEGQTQKVLIVTLSGTRININYTPNTTVRQLKTMIQDKSEKNTN